MRTHTHTYTHADGVLTNLCVRLLKLIVRVGAHKPFSMSAAVLFGELVAEISPQGESTARDCVRMSDVAVSAGYEQACGCRNSLSIV